MKISYGRRFGSIRYSGKIKEWNLGLYLYTTLHMENTNDDRVEMDNELTSAVPIWGGVGWTEGLPICFVAFIYTIWRCYLT